MIRRIISSFFYELAHVRRTTAFHYSLLATLIASVITCTLMVMIYQAARQEILAQIDTRLMAETVRLRRYYDRRSNLSLYSINTGIPDRIQTEPSMSYCITSQNSQVGPNRPTIATNNMILLDSLFSDLCMLDKNNAIQETQENDLLSLINSKEDDRLMRVVITPLSDNHTLIVGYDTHDERKILRGMLSMVFFATTLLILASLFGSFMISRMITNSIRRISRTARRIVDGDFDERIQIKSSDSNEMQSLVGDLNHMLERIHSLVTSQRQVTNNIAHDMRSPLNRLRSRMEVSLIDRQRSNEELRTVIGESIEDIGKMLSTFNAMLSIAQVEARARDDFTITNLSVICEELAELYDVFIEETGELGFDSNIEENLNVHGNRQLIAQAITNVLDNAVKYTPKGGHIHLAAKRENHQIMVQVIDNGDGIPVEHYEHVLNRFVRLDSARSTPGNGLGLSMVVAVMNLHNGEIQLSNNQPGLCVTLKFPISQSQQKIVNNSHRFKLRKN